MKKHLKQSIGLILLIVTVTSCVNRKNGKASITIRSKTQHHADVKVYHYKNITPINLVKSKTDSLGNCSFEIELQKPMLVMLQIGDKYGEVYLSSGDNITIEENGKDDQPFLVFLGDRKKLNNGLARYNSAFEKVRWGKGNIPTLSRSEYLNRLDSLKTIFTNFKDSTTLSDDESTVIEAKNKIKLLEFEQEYYFYQYNDAVNQKWTAFKNGKLYEDAKTSKEFEMQLSDIPYDTSLLVYTDYQMLLNMFWHNKIDLPTREIIGPGGQTQLIPLISDSLIVKNDLPNGIGEYMRAFNLNVWFMGFGITPETDSVFAKLKRTNINSKYLSALNKTYQEWLAIAPGKPAPHFEGTTLDGKKVAIEDLKGKIVYVDVWATWCGPCKEEIPFSKKLQQEFSNEKTVQFLNVSLDQDRTAWERFLANDKTWKGLHIIIDPKERNKIYESYKMYGIPAFFLIDKSGNVVYIKAPRPSDKKINDEIKKLIAENR